MMPAGAYDLVAPRPDAIDQRTAGAENPAVEYCIARPAGQCDVPGVKTDEIGEAALGQSRICNTESLRSALERAFEQRTPG